MKIGKFWGTVLTICFLGAIHNAQAQATNSTQRILQMRTFREGLFWIGTNAPSESESARLLDILQHGQEPNWTDRVEEFLNEYPNSPWAASLHHDYASFCRRTGRTTKALAHWQAAWDLTRKDTSEQGIRLGGAILANWMDLLSSLGRLDKLKELIAAGDQWHFVDHRDFDKYQGAKNSYYVMLAHPGVSYRCGTFALRAVGSVLQPDNRSLPGLAAIPSPTNGFSMAALVDLARQHGLDLTAVRRKEGDQLVVPSVVHWRENHYAAILAVQGDSYLVSDPTFGSEKWLPASAINEEASGEFLIPRQSMSPGWTQLAQTELAKIHGMGNPNNINDGGDCGCPKKCPSCPPPKGMPIWWVTEPYVNLWMADEPLSYMTSQGEFPFEITFKQRDTFPNQPAQYPGNPGWENSWLSSVHLQGEVVCGGGSCTLALSQSSASAYLPNGGEVDFGPGQTYDQETRLLLQQIGPGGINTGGDNGNNGLRLVHADGSQDIYGDVLEYNYFSGDYPEADCLLSRHIDPNGNTTVFYYTNFLGAGSFVNFVVDPDGRTNTLTYVQNSYRFLLSQVQNPYGLTASFHYDANFNLTNIVDAAGMSSSLTYDSSNNPTALITPYGTTTFSLANSGVSYGYGNAGGDNNTLIDRSALVVDPTGATNLYIYRYDSETPNSSASFSSGVPTGTPLGTLDTGSGTNLAPVYFRNSYHWGPRQVGYLSTQNISNFVAKDYLLAEMKHWLQDTNYLLLSDLISVQRDPSPDGGNTEGLKTFYDYVGKTANYIEGTVELPSVISWVLPNGQTHYEYRQYDYFGNITNDTTTYTTANGAVGTRTDQFVFANNTYTYFQGYGTGLIYSNSYAIPDLLMKVIAPDGNPVWSYGGFDSVEWTNNFTDAYGDTNGTITTSLRVTPDYATNGIGQVMTDTFSAPRSIVQYNPNNDGVYYTLYSGYNQIASSASVAGLTTTNTYNANGFLAQTIGLQIGRTNSFSYGNNGLVATFTDELGLNLSATWDNLLRLTSVQYPDGTYVSNLYDRLDLGGRRDRLGNWTSYVHDGARHLIAVTNANQAATQYFWCGCGALTEILDPLQNPTFLNYDTQGNLTNVSFPDGSAFNYQYDSAERRISIGDGAGRAWGIGYNNQGLVTTISNAFGQVEARVYDIRDREQSVLDANNVTVTNAFDPLDRILSRTWPDGSLEGFAYSAQGLTLYTNRDGKVTRYGRDAASRIVVVTNANMEVVQFAYDPAGDVTRLVDGLNHTNTWQYSQFGWMTNKVDGLGANDFQFSYNADGWVTNRLTPEKGNTGYGYDNVGNLKAINYPLSAINFSYDPLNQLTNMADRVGTTIFSYTQVGQMASEVGPWANEGLTNTYTQRLRTGLALNSPLSTLNFSYGYDAAWRMTNIVSPAGSFSYAYNFQPASLLVSEIGLPNFASITNSYDAQGRLTQTALNNYWGHTLDAYTYGYDPVGLRTNILRNLGLTASSVAAGYDNIGQLISWTAKETNGAVRLNEQLTFGFDSADNLHARTNAALVQTFSVDAANELTNVSRIGAFTLNGAVPAPVTNLTVNGLVAQSYGDFTFASTNNTLANGTNSFSIVAKNVYGFASTNNLSLNLPASVNLSFDRNGNLTNDGTRAFAYDTENQLTNITLPGQWRSDFVYDGLRRRRITRDFAWQSGAWVLTNEVHLIYDGYLLIQDRDTNNNPLVTYTHGLDLSHSLRGAGGIGGLLARTDTNGSTFYHADGNGNVTSLMDTNQNVVARYLYGPFGKLIGQWGSMASANEIQFSSMPQHDGLTFYTFRAYEPNFQRWLNRDPIGEQGGINLYRFVGNEPLGRRDRWGFDEDVDDDGEGGGGQSVFGSEGDPTPAQEAQNEAVNQAEQDEAAAEAQQAADNQAQQAAEQAAESYQSPDSQGSQGANAPPSQAQGQSSGPAPQVLTPDELDDLAKNLDKEPEKPDKDEDKDKKPPCPKAKPTPKWPGNNPKVGPPGTQWRGQPGSNPGDPQGSYYNPDTGESYHPDLDHPDPVGPHWDYVSPDGTQYRIMPDGSAVPK